MKQLILYSTDGCHLCEEARRLIAALPGITAVELDIAERDELLARYGTRIPVVRRTDTGAELGWPFGPDELRAWWRRSARGQ